MSQTAKQRAASMRNLRKARAALQSKGRTKRRRRRQRAS